MAEMRTGDTVVTADSDDAVILVDDPAPKDIKAQGDTIVTDPNSDDAVQLVDTPEGLRPPTAGELRAKGYTVPDELADDDVPATYAGDVRVGADSDDAVILVSLPESDADDGLTPMERAAQGDAEPEAPEPEAPEPEAPEPADTADTSESALSKTSRTTKAKA